MWIRFALGLPKTANSSQISNKQIREDCCGIQMDLWDLRMYTHHWALWVCASTRGCQNSDGLFFHKQVFQQSLIGPLIHSFICSSISWQLKLCQNCSKRCYFAPISLIHFMETGYSVVWLGAPMFPSLTSVAWAACLLGLGQLEHQKVGASPLTSVIRSRHSDGQIGHYSALQPLNQPAVVEIQLRPFK